MKKKLIINHELVNTWEPSFKQFTLLPSIGYTEGYPFKSSIYISWLIWDYSINWVWKSKK
jgi:hypothetical protein